MEEFKLGGTEYIELKNLLKVTALCETGSEAKAAITEGKVEVDGKVETRKACKIKSGQVISFNGKQIKVLK